VIKMSDTLIFSQRLKESRLKKDMTQKDLAEKIGTTSATVSAYESSNDDKRKSPTLENAISIAKSLNVSLDWLSGLSNNTGLETKNDNENEDIPLPVLLQKIVDIKILDAEIGVVNPDNSDYNPRFCAQINIFNKEVVDFFRSWEKICGLYKDEAITEEMRDDWVRGALNKYSDYIVFQNGTVVGTDGLPF